MDLKPAKYVFLTLRQRLGIYEIRDAVPIITIGNQKFMRDDDEDTHGFYDWLKDSTRKIIGIRLFLFEDYQFVIDNFRTYEYVGSETTKLGNTLIYLYFSEQREFSDSLSDDQLFTGNYFYRSESREIAMTFEAPDVSLSLPSN